MMRRTGSVAVLAASALVWAIAVPAAAPAATVSMGTRSETAPKGPDYQVPVVLIAGDASAESVELTSATRVRGDVRAGAGCTQSAPDQVDCGFAVAISVTLGAGDDRLVAAAMTTPLAADGGPGADALESQGASASLSGGDGDDALRSDGSRAALVGGRGSDRLQAASGASATWPDEAGAVEIDLRAGVARTPSGVDTLVGDFGSLYLGPGDDRVLASDGAVSVYGRAGNDIVLGGAGADWIMGDEGDDVISGGAGDDELFGGSGADRVSGGDGDDTLNAGPYIASFGWTGDRLAGDAGADVLTGRGRLDGGAGDDRLAMPGDGGRRYDRLAHVTCGPGADHVEGPGAYVHLPGDCERISGVHADGSTVTFVRTRAGGRAISVHGPRCRRRAVVSRGGRTRTFAAARPSRSWTRVLLSRSPLRPTLVTLSRCDGGRLAPVVTFGR
jgi:hypothetical protein